MICAFKTAFKRGDAHLEREIEMPHRLRCAESRSNAEPAAPSSPFIATAATLSTAPPSSSSSPSVSTSPSEESTRVPKLYGLVISRDTLVEFLQQYISHTGTLPDKLEGNFQADFGRVHQDDTKPGSSLSPDPRSQAPVMEGRRQEWGRQIERTVRNLHAIDAVWGDAKAQNVLIDARDDAWVVDFGGG